MDYLPGSASLPVQYLASAFENVTNSYKYYWFLAILEHVMHNQTRYIATNDLLAHMVAGVWYPNNYFRLSFGKMDRLGQAADLLNTREILPITATKTKVIHAVQDFLTKDPAGSKDIKSLEKFVPYRFIRPFFNIQLRGLPDSKINESIRQLAETAYSDPTSPCLYRFTTSGIEIHPRWFDYLNQHLLILTDFCLWNLINYIQKNNPNVPNIASKLFEPSQRDLKLARSFWNQVFDDAAAGIPCIYSGQVMTREVYSLDHFLPWRFVAHDLAWNIIPTPKNVNASKNDCIPNLSQYFEPFARLQYQAIHAVAPRAKIPEEYALLFNISSNSEILALPFHNFQETLRTVIAPQVQIAVNMGFTSNWVYSK